MSTTVVEIDDPPVAEDDAESTPEDTPVTIDVADNDSDVDGNLDPTTVTILSGPDNGTATVNPTTGAVTYTPNPDYTGTDTITYQICDTSPTPLCDTATATIAVNALNDPPVANSDAVSTPEDTPITIDVADNDTDPDGNLDPTTVTIITPPTNGTVSVDPVTGAITYTPNPNYSGPDTFTYQICDTTSPTPMCDTATVEVAVEPVNDPPVLVGPESVTVALGGTPNPLQIVDPEGHDYAVTIIAGSLPAGLTLAADGTFAGKTTTPGTYTVTYRACDDQSPPACSDFTVVYSVEILPVTGVGLIGLTFAGVLAALLGVFVLLGTRRHGEATGS